MSASLAHVKSGIDRLSDAIESSNDGLKGFDSSKVSTPSVPQFVFDFEKLQLKMNTFHGKFDEFIANGREKVLADRNVFENEIAEAKEQQQHLLIQIKHYKDKEAELTQENAREQQEVQETEQSIAEFTQKKQELTVLRDAVIRQITETQKMLEKLRQERSNERSKLLAQSSLNAPELAFWEKNLGMRIEGVQDDCLKVIFTLVSESAWDKEYYVLIDLGARDYEIQKCEPQLDKNVLEDLIVRLNESRDFSRFLKELRMAFKRSGL
ncbi:chromosome segregation protein Spc25-domain-containing protein [Lipomyces japonicus]|uniref:chromosome segregation protein Spc25-domain-containing protein n=1 Tax=Lipomyces japonicus TaxID=56871 RepID=UPI0034CFD719